MLALVLWALAGGRRQPAEVLGLLVLVSAHNGGKGEKFQSRGLVEELGKRCGLLWHCRSRKEKKRKDSKRVMGILGVDWL